VLRTGFLGGMKPIAANRHNYRYYDFVMAAFVTVLICSNLIGPAKIAQVDVPLLGALTFCAGVLWNAVRRTAAASCHPSNVASSSANAHATSPSRKSQTAIITAAPV
jgi:hypothetical protein